MSRALIPEQDLYLFNRGELTRAWKHFGAHAVDGGFRFALWAPQAKEIAVSGDFNDWNGQALEPRGTTGVWEGVVAGALLDLDQQPGGLAIRRDQQAGPLRIAIERSFERCAVRRGARR